MTNDNIVQLSPDKIKFNTIDEALTALKNGGFVVVADDEGRENEGDLICAASSTTPQMVNFMAREARGLICVAVTEQRAKELQLHPMVSDNTDQNQTAFTISVDAGPEFGVTTGISAADRATTIQRLISPNATAKDFSRPGHIFPLIAQNGTVLRRVGHTEAAIDLVRLAGLPQMGVICEIMNDDGAMARRDDLAAFAKKHDFPFITIAQLIAHRMESERFVVRQIKTKLNTQFGEFTAIGYNDTLNGVEHLALIKGSLSSLRETTPLVRVQHENMIYDIFGNTDNPTIQNLSQAMRFMEQQGAGIIIYLRSASGSNYGLLGTLKNHDQLLNQEPERHVLANLHNDLRDYGVGAQILNDLGVHRFRMVTNSPKKIIALRGYGLEVVETVPFPVGSTRNRFDFSQAIMPPLAPPAPAVIPTTETPTATAQQETVIAKAPIQEPVSVQESTPDVASTPTPAPAAQNTNPFTPIVAANDKPNAKVEDKKVEVKTETKEQKTMTMRMGAQIVSNQAMFEG
jgi:3,4-dihydroxy 2-butanone 4-phosphate synthase/GTP cyclohydrolase II